MLHTMSWTRSTELKPHEKNVSTFKTHLKSNDHVEEHEDLKEKMIAILFRIDIVCVLNFLH